MLGLNLSDTFYIYAYPNIFGGIYNKSLGYGSLWDFERIWFCKCLGGLTLIRLLEYLKLIEIDYLTLGSPHVNELN